MPSQPLSLEKALIGLSPILRDLPELFHLTSASIVSVATTTIPQIRHRTPERTVSNNVVFIGCFLGLHASFWGVCRNGFPRFVSFEKCLEKLVPFGSGGVRGGNEVAVGGRAPSFTGGEGRFSFGVQEILLLPSSIPYFEVR